jgi:hypothetical protein
MIPALTAPAKGRSIPATASFGAVADRINLLKPCSVHYSSPTVSPIVQTDAAANNINQWIPGDPSQGSYPPGVGSSPLVTMDGPVTGPSGASNAYKLTEVADGVPA